jgi:hypothetical protein
MGRGDCSANNALAGMRGLWSTHLSVTNGDPPGAKALLPRAWMTQGWGGDDVDAPPSKPVGRRAKSGGDEKGRTYGPLEVLHFALRGRDAEGVHRT